MLDYRRINWDLDSCLYSSRLNGAVIGARNTKTHNSFNSKSTKFEKECDQTNKETVLKLKLKHIKYETQFKYTNAERNELF